MRRLKLRSDVCVCVCPWILSHIIHVSLMNRQTQCHKSTLKSITLKDIITQYNQELSHHVVIQWLHTSYVT